MDFLPDVKNCVDDFSVSLSQTASHIHTVTPVYTPNILLMKVLNGNKGRAVSSIVVTSQQALLSA